jgi:metalloendopeptidase OMA1, mitochondrial
VSGTCLPSRNASHAGLSRALRGAVRGLALAGALWAAGCGFPAGPQGGGGQGPGHREQRLGLSPEEELKVGRQAYREVLQKYSGRILSKNAPESQRVRRVAERIIEATKNRLLQQEINLLQRGYQFEWEVAVVRDRQANAFCLPAGKIVVFTGILPIAANDDQLATVLSHEIAHALAHHASERIALEQRQGTGILATLQNLSHSRQQELEADHIGVFLMTFAGYRPEEAVRFWERMQEATGQGRQVPPFLSDHPSDRERIQRMQQWVPWAMRAKKAFDEGRVVPSGGR